VRIALVVCAFVFLASCRREPPPPPPTPAPILDPTPTPIADKAIAQGEAEDREDPSWLAGMWQEGDKDHWYLFNMPNEVAELQGKPVTGVRRGKLVVHGRYVSVIFPDGEIHFTASKDHSELSSDSPRAVYHRGSAP
jgi:hypothetical protein